MSGFVDEHMYFVDGNDAVTTSLFKNKKKKPIANYRVWPITVVFFYFYI